MGACLAGDGVVLVAALDVGEVEVVLLGCCQEESAEHLVGIGVALVDVVAAVAAQEVAHRHLEVEVALGNSHFIIFEGGIGAHSTGTADEDLALVL